MTAWMRERDVAGPAHAAWFDDSKLAWRTECGAKMRVVETQPIAGYRCELCKTIVLVADTAVRERLADHPRELEALADAAALKRDMVHRALRRGIAERWARRSGKGWALA